MHDVSGVVLVEPVRDVTFESKRRLLDAGAGVELKVSDGIAN